jgi:hypothetical protein
VCKQTEREIDALGMTMVVMVVVVVMVEPYLRPIHSCNAHRDFETESRRRRRKRGERERERERERDMSNPVREFLKEEGTHWRNQTFQRGGSSVIWYGVGDL